MNYRELSTPALTIDLGILERNLDRMAAYCQQHGIGLRPHIKTHKTPEVARMQLERGALGLTAAKVGEVEVMASAGFGSGPDEILLAYPVYGADKLQRLATLAETRRILVSLDDEATAGDLSRAASRSGVTFGVLVEFDAGHRRCGLQPGPACVSLARKIEKLPGLSFRGLMTFFGNIWGTEEERKNELRPVADRVEQALDAFAKMRMAVEIVSAGSTPSHLFSHLIPGLTEIRPGTYAYNDLNTLYQGVCALADCAARVVATVVSTAVPHRTIIDAGSKTLSSDPLGSGPKSGHGYVLEAPDANLFKLNEEHGFLDITNSAHHFHVGEVVTVIPTHVCTCVNMHDEVFLVRNEQVVGCWPVVARGKIR
jgi:D-serine deaminase-like pyridoxal phosphate-dependent protein